MVHGGPNLLWISLSMIMGFLVSSNTFGQGDDIKKIKEFNTQGIALQDKEEYEKSIKYFDSSIAAAKVVNNNPALWQTLYLRGHSYIEDDQNQKAFDDFYACVTLAKTLKSYERELMSNSGLVSVFKKTNQYAKALTLSNKILATIDTTILKDTSVHASIIAASIEVYLDTERYDLVLKHADQGIALCKKLDYKEVLIDLYIKKGIVYYYKKAYPTSLEYLSKAETLLQNDTVKKPFYNTVNASYFVASNYYQQGLYKDAIERLHRNIDGSEKKDALKLPVLQSYLLLANSYSKVKDYEKAVYWKNSYVQLNESFQKQKDSTVNRIYQNEEQVLKGNIANLREEQLQNERIKKYAYSIAILLFLLLATGTFLYHKKQKKNKVVFERLVKKINNLETKEAVVVDQKEVAKIIIDDEKVDEILKGVSRLEAQEFYLRSDCTLRVVAKKVKTNATYLSKIINIHYKKNFNEYINDLRIEYALQRIKNDRKFRNFSIKSIATEIGYKSDQSFTKHFKAKTGLNPSYYIKNIQKQQSENKNI